MMTKRILILNLKKKKKKVQKPNSLPKVTEPGTGEILISPQAHLTLSWCFKPLHPTPLLFVLPFGEDQTVYRGCLVNLRPSDHELMS